MFTIKFHRKGGCSRGIIDEMARYDAMLVVSLVRDDTCEPDHYVEVRLEPKRVGFQPTMGRWASFAVGAQLLR